MNIEMKKEKITELQVQIEQYDTLGFFKSARGIASSGIIVALFMSIVQLYSQNNMRTIFSHVLWIWIRNPINVILPLIIGYFVFKGHRWAMIVSAIQIFFIMPMSPIGIVLLIAIYYYYYIAFRVEYIRRIKIEKKMY